MPFSFQGSCRMIWQLLFVKKELGAVSSGKDAIWFAYHQGDVISRGIWLDIKFHFLEGHIYHNSGFMSPGTAKVVIVNSVTILWMAHWPGSITLILTEEHLKKNYSRFFFCSGIHVVKDVCLGRGWGHCQNLIKVKAELH